MRVQRVLLLCALVTLLPIAAQADYLEVSRNATIKVAPNSDAAIVQRIEPGVYLLLLEDAQTDGYYHVQSAAGEWRGWIYRTLARRYTGNPPVAVTESGAAAISGNLIGDPGGVLTDEQITFSARHLAVGKPVAIYERVHEGYALAYDARLKIPIWVQYYVTREDLTGTSERSDDFRPDTSIPRGSRSELSDYRSSGYDRGHMAPAADMKRSDEVMSESFFLSNMSPQVGQGYNRGIWRVLETAVRDWVNQRGSLTVIIGPIFTINQNRASYRVIGGNSVAVPNSFYKIVVDHSSDDVEVLAFLMPNENLSGRELHEFLVSVDEIEGLTGLDFLSNLPDDIERTVEALEPSEIW